MKNLLFIAVISVFTGLICSQVFSYSEEVTASKGTSSDKQNLSFDTLAEKANWYAEQVSSSARNAPSYAVTIAEEALSYFEEYPNAQARATVLNESSYALYFLSQLPEAITRAKTAELFSRSHQLDHSLARALQLQGNVLQAVGEFESALKLYREAMLFYRQQNKTDDYGRVLNNIANTYFSAGQYDSAIEFYSQAGEVANSPQDKGSMYLGFGNVYSAKNQSAEAIAAYEQAFDLFQLSQDQIGRELALSGMCDQLISQNKAEQALPLINSALESAIAGNRKFRQVNMLQLKAQALSQLNKFDQALNTVDVAVALATSSQDKRNLVLSYRSKSTILEKLGRYAEAFNSLNDSLAFENSFADAQSNVSLAVMRAVFEVEQKNHQIDLLSSQNKIQQLEIKQQQVMLLSSIVIFLFLAGLAFFVFYQRTQARLLADEKKVSVRLKELDILKDQVLVNTSHELRTPLNGIIGLTQFVLEDESSPLPEVAREHIELVSQCGYRLLNLVEDILDMTQLKAGRINLNIQAIDVSLVINQVCSFVKPMAEKKSLKVVACIDDNIPLVRADVKRLHQIILNLVGNSIKFSDYGVIQIKVSRVPDGVKICVVDQGIGIRPELFKEIFKPFGQVDSSLSRGNEGSGLGLPITQELLLLHQSQLEVHSVYGKGSEFCFVLACAAIAEST